MTSRRFTSMLVPVLLTTGLSIVLVAATQAQVTKETSTEVGAATKTVKVERAEVVYVSGNDLVVKKEDGSLRHFANVSESVKVTVDGQQLGIHDLKPGMKLERTITTTTTPRTVTTVQSVTGTVWHVTPPLSVILTLENGKNQEFKIPNGQKFNVNGEMVDAFGLKNGMKISATRIVEVPETLVSQQRNVTGEMPPPPPAPPADQPILVVVMQPTSQPAASAPTPEATPTKLPQTGSLAPLAALLGLISICLSLALGRLRKL